MNLGITVHLFNRPQVDTLRMTTQKYNFFFSQIYLNVISFPEVYLNETLCLATYFFQRICNNQFNYFKIQRCLLDMDASVILENYP